MRGYKKQIFKGIQKVQLIRGVIWKIRLNYFVLIWMER